MTAGEICVREVVFITPGENVSTAARLMHEHHVGCLVVVKDDASARTPIGIVTDRDIAVRTIGRGVETPGRVPVKEIMTAEPVVVSAAISAQDALKRMRHRGVRRVPVVDETGAIVGLLSFDDLLEWLAVQFLDLSRVLSREQRIEKQETMPPAMQRVAGGSRPRG